MTSFTPAQRRAPARRAAATGVAAAVLLLSACGGPDHDRSEPGHDGQGSSAPATGGTGSFNDADVSFAQMMIPHHEQALRMARLADGRAAGTEIKSIAAKIEKAQDPEIRTLRKWLESWHAPDAVESMPGMHHGSGDGMMSDADLAHLKDAKGPAFDQMFAEMMIDHHNGAIAMAREERRNGRHAGAVKLAGTVVEDQSTEVEQLERVLDRP